MKGLKNVTALDYNTLANMYRTDADKKTGAAKTAALNKAIEVFNELAEKFPSVADFAMYQNAHIGFEIDPETKLGTAKPFYEKLITIIKGHETPVYNFFSSLCFMDHFVGHTINSASVELCAASRPSTFTVRPRPRCQRIETSCPR